MTQDSDDNPVSDLVESTMREIERVLQDAPQRDAATEAALRVVMADPDLAKAVAIAYHAGRFKGASDVAEVVYEKVEKLVTLIAAGRAKEVAS